MAKDLLFFIFLYYGFALAGWLIETVYKSIIHGRLVAPLSYLGLPFAEIYGIAGILLVTFFQISSSWPHILVIFVAAVLMSLLEYLGGWWCQIVLRERLWDYRRNRFNIHGHTDLQHAMYWFFLVAFAYHFVVQKWQNFAAFRSALEAIPSFWQILLLLLFLLTQGILLRRRLALSAKVSRRAARKKRR